MSLCSDDLKSAVASYFRYEEQAALIAFEASDSLLWGGEPADVLVLTEGRHLYEIEVKISLSDLRHDKIKSKHARFYSSVTHPVNRFYFAVPKEMAEESKRIVERMYPYAGVLSVNGYSVESVKKVKTLHSRRLSLKCIAELAKQQSGTLCRLARAQRETCNRAEEWWRELNLLRKQLKSLKDGTAFPDSTLCETCPEPGPTFAEIFGEPKK